MRERIKDDRLLSTVPEEEELESEDARSLDEEHVAPMSVLQNTKERGKFDIN